MTLTANFDLDVTQLSSNDAAFAVGTPSPPLPAHLAAGQTDHASRSPSRPRRPTSRRPTSRRRPPGAPVAFGLSGTGRTSRALSSRPPRRPSAWAEPSSTGRPVTGSATLRNAGSVPSPSTVAPRARLPFSVSGPAGRGLAPSVPGAQVTATVTFAPTTTGVFTDEIDLDYNRRRHRGAGLGHGHHRAPHGAQRDGDPLRRRDVGGSKSLSFTVTNDGGGAAHAHQVEAAHRRVHGHDHHRRGHHDPGR